MSGLKFCVVVFFCVIIIVSPYIGEWIEIEIIETFDNLEDVSPYIGEWIEIKTNDSYSGGFWRLTLHR